MQYNLINIYIKMNEFNNLEYENGWNYYGIFTT